MLTPDEFNQRANGKLPGSIGVVIKHIAVGEVHAELAVSPIAMAPNGFLHAGSVVTLADTSCGCGCAANLPEGASGYTTIELKSNHLGTAREGHLDCVAKAAHLGKSTQVWDAVVKHRESGRTIALFRCTQMVLYPK
ncbi:MAG: PaaI family thioesterase [Betaproteobacteria bacterium]|nr:PaaI family thioesterase [Betaproteobacteria bacterium]